MRQLLNIILSLSLAALVSCSGAKSDKPVLTVSIPPEEYIVSKIAGDKMEVRTLLTQGANPESYEPTMANMRDMEMSEAYLRIGNLSFEDAIISKVKSSKPDLRVYDISTGITMMTGTHEGCGHHHHTKADGDHGEPDPHVWSSVTNARIMADNTLKALKELDPDNADYYTSRHVAFMAELDSLDAAVRSELAAAPSRSFIVWHPSLSYFARDYGLEQLSLGGAENKELSALNLRDKIDRARNGEATVMLLQRDFDSSRAEAANREIGAKIVYINPLNPDWAAEMLSTARAIAGK